MITRLSIAFEDFLGSSIAAQVMPPCMTRTFFTCSGQMSGLKFKYPDSQSVFCGQQKERDRALQQSDFTCKVRLWLQSVQNALQSAFCCEVISQGLALGPRLCIWTALSRGCTAVEKDMAEDFTNYKQTDRQNKHSTILKPQTLIAFLFVSCSSEKMATKSSFREWQKIISAAGRSQKVLVL